MNAISPETQRLNDDLYAWMHIGGLATLQAIEANLARDEVIAKELVEATRGIDAESAALQDTLPKAEITYRGMFTEMVLSDYLDAAAEHKYIKSLLIAAELEEGN